MNFREKFLLNHISFPTQQKPYAHSFHEIYSLFSKITNNKICTPTPTTPTQRRNDASLAKFLEKTLKSEGGAWDVHSYFEKSYLSLEY